MNEMNLKVILSKVWRGEKPEIGEVIFLLERLGADEVAEILGQLSRKEVPVNRAQELLEEAATCVRQ